MKRIMNKDQIKNGEVRVFPFYKEEYLGELPLGYSNRKSALKFMKEIPNAFGGYGIEVCSTPIVLTIK